MDFAALYPSYELSLTDRSQQDARKAESIRSNFLNPIDMICPVQPSLQKYTSSRRPQISPTSQPVPARQEGRIAIVTDVGSECGGRGSARYADKIAGRALACERSAARQTSGVFAYGKSAWFWHPWLVSS